ncbi:dUTPase, partial [Campylobacter jejuni]
ECAELIDSFAWKHWKNISSPTNWENVRIEIIDIWHFILSLLLEEYRDKNGKDFKAIATEVNAASVFQDFCKEEEHPNESDIYGILNDIELIIHKCSGFGFNLGELLSTYFTLAIKCGLNLEILYKTYIGKNVLNIFRQNNGYKDGSYKKTWNNKEDNEVLAQILEQELDFDTIYKKLEEYYKKA